MIAVTPTEIADVKIITPTRHGDARGFFVEAYNRTRLEAAGIPFEVAQENHAYSAVAGTLRGLHFQSPPKAQAKIVRVMCGRILDVVVDIRWSSPTFGRHVAVELSADDGRQLFVPKGFAHGNVTLSADCDVVYLVDAPYAPSHDHGIAFDDPALAIAWPFAVADMVISDKDRRHPRLAVSSHLFP